jgi:hypothetical protein
VSEQLAIDFCRQVGRREYVLRKVLEQREIFRPDFYDWIKSNLHVWERFELEANRVRSAGRKHYSARTIGEVLRHESALVAANDGEWKLNDHRWPDLARLYMLLDKDREGFFETRGRAA